MCNSHNEEGFDLASVVAADVARASTSFIEPCQVWIRKDAQVMCLRGSGREGPDECNVLQRRTYCAVTGELLIADEDLGRPRRFHAHRAFDAPVDTVTILLFSCTQLSCPEVTDPC